MLNKISLLAVMAFIAGPALAQDAPPAEEPGVAPPAVSEPAPAPVAEKPAAAPGVEEILVTGSRIGRTNLESFGHVTLVTAEDIARSGASTIDELLKELPSVSLQGLGKGDNNGGDGFAWVDLRNLGVSRTLVLVNGKRFPTSGEVVDLNNVPVYLIERIEVLFDGASSIYGSDAVAGVINIIFKDDVDGLYLDASTGISGKGDHEEYSVSATMGTDFKGGNTTLNFSYMRREPVFQRDRDWAKDPVVDAFYNVDPTTLSKSQIEDLACVPGPGGSNDDPDSPIGCIYGSSAVPEGRIGGVFFRPDPATGLSFQPLNSLEHDKRYNYGQSQWLVGRNERFAFTMLGHRDITENSEAYVDGTYTRRESRNRLAPQPFLGGNSTYPLGFVVPVTNPYIPEDYLITRPPGTETLVLARRNIDVGDRIYDNFSDTYRIVGGVRGELLDEYKWDLYVNYGHNETDQTIINSIDLTRAIQTADPVKCAQNAAAGCVVGNYFGAGSIQPEVADYIRYTDTSVIIDDMFNTGASISGDLIQLPGGQLGAAIGAEYRELRALFRPDAKTVGGDSAGNALDITKGKYNVKEAFGELSVPVMRGMTGLEDLTVDLAGRYSSYDTFGSEMTYRAALSYAPVADVRFRTVYSTSFRAPGVADLFGGATDSFEGLDDPCNDWGARASNDPIALNCANQGVAPDFNQNNVTGSQIRTTFRSNEKLDAETAKVFNVGMVITPKVLPQYLRQFSASVDYYVARVEDAISFPEAQGVLDTCYGSEELSHPFCANIQRGSNGAVSQFDVPIDNVGSHVTTGWDLTVNYGLPLSLFGVPGGLRADMGWHGNYMNIYDETIIIEGQPEVRNKLGGTIQAFQGPYPRLRWVARWGVAGESWSFNSYHRYIAGTRVFGAFNDQPFAAVKDASYWDIVGQYNIGEMMVIAGVDNLLDKDPPFFLEGGQNANQRYDFVGRFVFLRLGYKL